MKTTFSDQLGIRVYLPELDNVWASNMKSNFSRVTNTIEYSPTTYHGKPKKLKNSANFVNSRGMILVLVLSILYF